MLVTSRLKCAHSQDNLLNEATENHLRVSHGNLNFSPAEVLRSHVGCTLSCSDLHQMFVVVVEEVGVVGVVG
jgi:hypothetical protein